MPFEQAPKMQCFKKKKNYEFSSGVAISDN